ncbi:uncharacterized protein [Notamacropus eugenii]|uniref:uncharacterized protein n=1 Tax=Notamacropus eugenii TaxID=9315 RepID=UPI003B66BD66
MSRWAEETMKCACAAAGTPRKGACSGCWACLLGLLPLLTKPGNEGERPRSQGATGRMRRAEQLLSECAVAKGRKRLRRTGPTWPSLRWPECPRARRRGSPAELPTPLRRHQEEGEPGPLPARPRHGAPALLGTWAPETDRGTAPSRDGSGDRKSQRPPPPASAQADLLLRHCPAPPGRLCAHCLSQASSAQRLPRAAEGRWRKSRSSSDASWALGGCCRPAPPPSLMSRPAPSSRALPPPLREG